MPSSNKVCLAYISFLREFCRMDTPNSDRDVSVYREESPSSPFIHGLLAHLARKQHNIYQTFPPLTKHDSWKTKRHEQWVITSSLFVDKDVTRQTGKKG